MNTPEIDRVAITIHALRPDWPVSSLRSFVSANLAMRAYRNVLIALTWIATDPETRTPGRVLDPGPWWDASRPDADKQPPHMPGEWGTLCGVCSRTRRMHDIAEAKVAPDQRHAFDTSDPAAEHAVNPADGAARVRDVLAAYQARQHQMGQRKAIA